MNNGEGYEIQFTIVVKLIFSAHAMLWAKIRNQAMLSANRGVCDPT
jgi:hypothetical protein